MNNTDFNVVEQFNSYIKFKRNINSRINTSNIQIGGQPPNFQPLEIPSQSNLNYMEPSKMTLYTVPEGTILYQGSEVDTFSPLNIKVGKGDERVSFFSSNKRMSADYIKGCASYPTEEGYLHIFKVRKNIDRILIVSSFEKRKNWTNDYIDNTFCRNYSFPINGIGFFFPYGVESNEQGDTERIAESTPEQKMLFDSEFALCNPNEYLDYVGTQRCQSMRKLSQPYHFSQ
jgi:hypothetical protein